jgi:cytidylate kinase
VTEEQLVITIDGPAGAGKSTIAKALARRLGWTYLDTGAMYRAVGFAAHRDGVDVADEPAMEKVVANLDLSVAPGDGTMRVFLGSREITGEIRRPHISKLASDASKLRVVREAMKELQQAIGRKGRVVAEGRDMGTVVFPEAGIKYFLQASLDERARRRFVEMEEAGEHVSLEEVRQDMAARDDADSSRSLAPLRPAEDSILVDSTALTIQEVLEDMITGICQKWPELSTK